MNQEFTPAEPVKSPSDEANTWAMILHLTLLITWSLVGIIAPIVIWQIKKDQFPIIDEHGKNAANWIISAFLYSIPLVILSFFVIGIPFLIALGIAGIVFPIIAGIKASNGEVWKYPLSLQIF